MVNRDIRIQYVAGDELKNIVELEEESEYEDSDASSVEEEDGISEFSDYSETEEFEEGFSGEDEESSTLTSADENQDNEVTDLDVHADHTPVPVCDNSNDGGMTQNARATNQIQNTLVGKDGTLWQTQPPATRRRRTTDIIRQAPGITSTADSTSVKEAFTLFITEVMIDLLVLETNREARRKIDEWNRKNPDVRKIWKPVDSIEIGLHAFVGLNILAGLHKSIREPISSLWSEKEGRPIYNATMSRSRFTEILKYLRFDNRATREERRAEDKLAAFRDFWTLFQAQLPKFYVPGTDLCVDEQLVAFRGRCPFRQYIPSKPAKYGMKIWWCCDADTTFPLKGEVYLGKQPDQPREIGQGARVVKDLVAP